MKQKVLRASTILCCLMVIKCWQPTARGAEQDVKYSNLTVSVIAPTNAPLGEDVAFLVQLTSHVEQEVCSIESADLRITIRENTTSTKKYVCNIGRIRQKTSILENGTTLVDTVYIAKRMVKMKAGAADTVEISVLRDFNERLPVGSYTVSAEYEKQVVGGTRFDVIANNERTIRALIKLIRGNDEWSRMWARRQALVVTGKAVLEPSANDTRERDEAQISDLLTWWERQKTAKKMRGP